MDYTLIIYVASLIFVSGSLFAKLKTLSERVDKLEANSYLTKTDLDAFEKRFKENLELVVENALLKSGSFVCPKRTYNKKQKEA